MNKERKDEFETWEARQRRLGEFITEAGKALKLEKPELVRAVADWLYTEADIDYFKEAAEKDEDDLPEFVEAAMKSWFEYNQHQQPGGPRNKLTVADAMSIIISVAHACATAADACATEPEKVKPNANKA